MDANQACALVAIVGIVVLFIFKYIQSIFDSH
jgi:hypothetical protein